VERACIGGKRSSLPTVQVIAFPGETLSQVSLRVWKEIGDTLEDPTISDRAWLALVLDFFWKGQLLDAEGGKNLCQKYTQTAKRIEHEEGEASDAENQQDSSGNSSGSE
jgi:hypothetical protein